MAKSYVIDDLILSESWLQVLPLCSPHSGREPFGVRAGIEAALALMASCNWHHVDETIPFVKTVRINGVPWSLLVTVVEGYNCATLGCGRIVDYNYLEHPIAAGIVRRDRSKSESADARDFLTALDRLCEQHNCALANSELNYTADECTPVSCAAYVLLGDSVPYQAARIDDYWDARPLLVSFIRNTKDYLPYARALVGLEKAISDPYVWEMVRRKPEPGEYGIIYAKVVSSTWRRRDFEVKFDAANAISTLAQFEGVEWRERPGWYQRSYTHDGLTYILVLPLSESVGGPLPPIALHVDVGLFSCEWAQASTLSTNDSFRVGDTLVSECRESSENNIRTAPAYAESDDA